MQYIATIKQGRSRIGVAGINLGNDSCIATARKVFESFGIDCEDVQWGDYTLNLKNYKQSPCFVAIDDVKAAQQLQIENKKTKDFLRSHYA